MGLSFRFWTLQYCYDLTLIIVVLGGFGRSCKEKESTLKCTIFLGPYKLYLVYFTSILYYCVFVCFLLLVVKKTIINIT
jgi:hypothetical protein